MIWTLLLGGVLFLCFCGPVAVVRFFLGVLTLLAMLLGTLYLIHLSFPDLSFPAKPAATQANAFALPDAQPQGSTGPQGGFLAPENRTPEHQGYLAPETEIRTRASSLNRVPRLT
jgi:hypothetical protein